MKLFFKKLHSKTLFLIQFSLDDLKNKYSNSFLGIVWCFLQPFVTILVYWFVFQLGFKSQPVENVPFILWLVSGLIPWFFISDAIPCSTTVLSEYGYLVQKVMFNIDVLPIIKTISALLVQTFLTLFLILMFWLFNFPPCIYDLQIIYYLAYMIIFTLGVCYMVSSLYVFFKDLLQIVSILLQIIFWFTPIVWSIDSMPNIIANVLRYNPVYFIVQGYRKTFVYKEWFWSDGIITFYYWAIAFALLLCGKRLFHKLKPHFADVL